MIKEHRPLCPVFEWIVAILIASIFGGAAKAGDWPKWRGPLGTGIADEALAAGFDAESVLWRKKVGTGYSSIVVAEGRAFTMGHEKGEEILWCFHALTGEEIWAVRWPAPLLDNLHEGGPSATPFVSESGKVFALGKNGDLVSCDSETGKKLWHVDLISLAGLKGPPEWGFSGSPLIVDGSLLVEAGSTLAFDPDSGELKWRSQPFRPAYGSPTPFKSSGQSLIAILKTDGLAVISTENGGTVAFSPWETAFDTNATTPIVSEGKIFLSTGYDRGCALFGFDGRALNKRYENQLLCTHMNNAVLFDGHLYGFDGTAHRGRPTEFVCLEWESGKERWRVPPTEGLGCGSLIATSDGKLLILSERGELVIAEASPEEFLLGTRVQILGGRCWTPPALVNGVLYARNARGDLVAVGGSLE